MLGSQERICPMLWVSYLVSLVSRADGNTGWARCVCQTLGISSNVTFVQIPFCEVGS
jgi:hypothetical protein